MFAALATLRRTLFTRLMAGIGGLLALGLTTMQTILGAMPSDSLPAITPGESVDSGRWRVAVLAASVTRDKRPDGYRGRSGTKSLVVELDLLNQTSETSNVVSRILAVDPPIAGIEAQPTFYLMRDHSILGALHPGLPERVKVVWAIPEETVPPTTLRLTITGETFKPRDNLLAAPGWFNPKVIGAVSLPLRAEASGDGA
ncbi:hypothetical protein [Bosea sp. (in: a-proteobacteria)]|jgi:hypothetical protein|uniref:hypothetical protein n=1 Tax=Bosea sp. (in: a-proteobacteria) TaxID=1871050 RepID=UPI003F6EF8C5